MKVALFYPPVGNICQPYLSTPALTAFLKQNGVKDVKQYDFNIEILDELLTPSRLKRAYRWSYHYLQKHSLNPDSTDLETVKIQLALNAVLTGTQTIENIDKAKQVFRSLQFHDKQKYNKALDTIHDAFQLLSSRYFPTVMNHQSFTMRYRLDSTENIIAAVNDRNENCFIEIFREKLAELFQSEGVPDIAGVSIGYYEQLIPGLTLASLIKHQSPNTHVTIGGTMMSALFGKTLSTEFFKLFDSIVFFEGEVPLLKLIHAIANNEDLEEIPNLMFMRDEKVVGTPINSCPLILNSVPTPDFSDLPLTKYFSPSPILPLASSRGCYWRKCAFCTRQHLIDTYRKRSPDQVIADIKQLQDKHGAKAFFFVDECFSPSTLNAIADRIIAEGIEMQWSCYVRFEAKLANKALCQKLADSGLRMLYFGLESACQRVLDLMKKGTKKETMAKILESTSSAGILNMILYFVGFPTETREEALETMEFLLENKQHITFAIAGHFLLENNSPIYSNPDDFDITDISQLSENSDLGIIYNYDVNSGLSSSEAIEVKDFINENTKELHSLEFLNRAHLLFMQQNTGKGVGVCDAT